LLSRETEKVRNQDMLEGAISQKVCTSHISERTQAH
jgi:hypothetical protein